MIHALEPLPGHLATQSWQVCPQSVQVVSMLSQITGRAERGDPLKTGSEA